MVRKGNVMGEYETVVTARPVGWHFDEECGEYVARFYERGNLMIVLSGLSSLEAAQERAAQVGQEFRI